MSRLAKWKLEKAKVKVVFRLQFHATHVPQAGWDKLFISFIPADSLKATAKTTKALVRNGTCKWGDPIYETTRLLQDTRTKQFDEKLYKIVVAMGTSRSSILGEAMINLAEYADALKPFAVALPLQGCDSGAILHVTVQLLTSKTGFREFEQQRELRERGPSTTPDHSSPDESSRSKTSPSDDSLSHVDKTNIRGTVRPNDPDSSMGFDVSSNTSGSLNADKHDISSTNEIDSLKSMVSGDLSGLAQSPQTEKDAREWHNGWGSEYLNKNSDLGNAIEENIKLKGFVEDMESSINEIKTEVNSLQCHADDIGSKAQEFSQILISEISSGDRLVREVSVLKSECSKLKEEMERLRSVKTHVGYNSKDQDNVSHNLQLRWLQGLSVVEDNIREIQKKVCYSYHDRDLRLFLADFESLLGVLLDFKRQISTVPSEKTTTLANKNERGISGSQLDTEIYQPELDPLQYLGMPDLTSREPNSADSANAMRDKILELVRGLDESKAERDSLTKKMDQMECYYESLVQELEETQRQLLVELQNLRTEHSTCIYSITGANAEMEALRQDVNEQALRFSEEKKTLVSLNEELDKRAMAAEAALKRARLNYSIAVNHLQKDLELLSSQVVSMFETNENLIKQAFPDPGDSKPEKQDTRDVKLTQFQNEKKGMKERPLKGDILLENLQRSLQVQESLYQKVEEELYEMHSRNLYLEVFSKILQETFLQASVDIRIMKGKIDELGWQLELSTEAKEMLKQRLDITLDEVFSLNEEKTTCIAKWNAVAFQNQSLEANLQNVTHENLILLQKIDELESVVLESKNWKNSYETCICEKKELAELLEKEALEKVHLQKRFATVQAEFDSLRDKFDDLATANENLQKDVGSLKDKLMNTLGCYNEKLISLPLAAEADITELKQKHENNVRLLVAKNEALGQEISELSSVTVEHGRTKLLVEELAEEKKGLLVSLLDKSQETLGLVRELENLRTTFDQELRIEKSSRQELESKMQDLTSEFTAKSSKLLRFDEQSSELVHLKQMVSDLELEKANHTHLLSGYETSLRSLNRDSSYISDLESQLLEMEQHKEYFEVLTALNGSRYVEAQYMDNNIKLLTDLDSVKSELKTERSLRNKLESRIEELASELDEKHLLLDNFDLQKSQVKLLEKMVAELESEKSSQSLEYERNARQESSFIEELFQCLIAGDVQHVVTKIQSETYIDDLAEQLRCCSKSHLEFQKKHADMESALNHCLVNEKRYMEENNQLLVNLEVLKSELESSTATSRALTDRNEEMSVELEEYTNRHGNAERSYSERNLCANEVEQLKSLLVEHEEEIEKLMVLKSEAEITVEVLKDKLAELCGKGASELEKLQNRCGDLTQKLSEQILKTEEFKSLSIHLKELKDNAEAECTRAREKTDYQAPLTPQQESLRIIFIKEQYETKLQELQHQLTMSKKHSEGILMKLQDSIDENETRKKAESSYLKRTKELEDKILELEADMQSVMNDRREKTTAYDMMKAELDCSLLSLECCKEEKQRLEDFLQEERLKMSKELESMRESVQRYSTQGVTELADKDIIASPRPKIQGAIQSRGVNENGDQSPSGEAMALDKSEESLALINDSFRAETLRSSLDHLNNELERMKNENLLESQDDNDSETRFPGLEQELMQLRQAKEELQSIFPLSHENYSCGNALERVLALEIELAEALRGKQKHSTIHFQSSFLKQHTDDEAIFQSFRDINDLIEEMLETKGRYASIETELREMHDRYSQLSLKFAEVEGERQKLMMTLKNVRASKKGMVLNRSSSATLGEH
ncbi:BnaAnng04220D [Brassica napus]|uniref:BnaAnng04220D protein n=1 Tax=Brassica napus TaxID=3708 RepID=A0A078GZJ7_BRANA|nr:BnaAnng04220D [Brassica napus]